MLQRAVINMQSELPDILADCKTSSVVVLPLRHNDCLPCSHAASKLSSAPAKWWSDQLPALQYPVVSTPPGLLIVAVPVPRAAPADLLPLWHNHHPALQYSRGSSADRDSGKTTDSRERELRSLGLTPGVSQRGASPASARLGAAGLGAAGLGAAGLGAAGLGALQPVGRGELHAANLSNRRDNLKVAGRGAVGLVVVQALVPLSPVPPMAVLLHY